MDVYQAQSAKNLQKRPFAHPGSQPCPTPPPRLREQAPLCGRRPPYLLGALPPRPLPILQRTAARMLQREAFVTMTPIRTAPHNQASSVDPLDTLTNSSTSAPTNTPASTAPLLPLRTGPPGERTHRTVLPASKLPTTSRT